MIKKEIISDTDSVYNYMDGDIVLGYLEIRLVDGVVDIMNLFASEDSRRKGIATALMDFAEREARSINSKIYLDVCLNSEYGPAQCFYIRRGYVPDGAGVYYEQEVLSINSPCFNDDELTLCLVKKL